MIVAEYKIGQNKGRPRIWIDGKRLKEAGFVGGEHYSCTVINGRIECILRSIQPTDGDLLMRDHMWSTIRKVSGRADGKPIIDLLGKDVEGAFPDGKRVQVIFEQGKLTITEVK